MQYHGKKTVELDYNKPNIFAIFFKFICSLEESI